ncbi:AAA family ATPase [bacterium]|nr:AAA family ATPase [bacterium]|tara:strand:+ start:695 stop:1204 length:510 start_codon:yes stop_codon:yes gene_type:complete
MKSKKNIVLVGMMGSGKSSIGKLLSKKLKLEFIDIDDKIEEKENNTISKIFNKNGESYFRNLEENVSINNLKLQNKIISLGGGGFINKKIRKQTMTNCISIWLSWKQETLINRIKNSKKRPMVIKLGLLKIRELIIYRSKIYNLSDFKINCDNLDKNQIVNKIVNFYEI